MKKAVIYSRTASREQTDQQSLKVQQELCSRWAHKHGYKIAGVYEDLGKSGSKLVGRNALHEMMIRCQEKGKHVDAVLVMDIDRIARNEIDYFFIKNELKKINIKLIMINQPQIDDSSEGQLLETILAGVNALYKKTSVNKRKKNL